MKTFVFLIITMGYSDVWLRLGHGGVSVTPVESLELCNVLKKNVEHQVELTKQLNKPNSGELIISCHQLVTNGEQ